MAALTLTAGSHTVKIQGNNTGAAGTLRYLIGNSSISVIVFG